MGSRIVVTDVTRMSHGNVCVGGYFTDGTPVRPVMQGGIHEHWLCLHPSHPCQPFAEIEVTTLGRPAVHPPHVEDVRINQAYSVARLLPEIEQRAWLNHTAVGTVDELFGVPVEGLPHQARWLVPGTGVCSLATLSPRLIQGVVAEQWGDGKASYKLRYVDHDGDAVTTKITDLRLTKHFEQRQASGDSPQRTAAALTAALKNAEVWLRIGLARPWVPRDAAEERCYLQVNGVYAFPDMLGVTPLADLLGCSPPDEDPFNW